LVSLASLAVDPRPLLIICFLQGMAAALAAVSLALIAVRYRDKGGLSLE
jgi:NADH:ubiquinone oxidoreductase subunit K